ncbi:hypothetical protein LEP1GSC072_2386 [Leptospira noguchii str. Bonito]|nr:hypothetical protein LEP1GSC072_2386 [Leptospira noguchii str. Bonito]
MWELTLLNKVFLSTLRNCGTTTFKQKNNSNFVRKTSSKKRCNKYLYNKKFIFHIY